MKKTYRNADGSTEEVEGTAEEIASYDRARSKTSEGPPAPRVDEGQGGRRILTDELQRVVDAAVKNFEEIARRLQALPTVTYVPYQVQRIEPWAPSSPWTWPYDWTITCSETISGGSTLAGTALETAGWISKLES